MVHCNNNSANGRTVGSRMLAMLPLLMIAFSGYAQEASPASTSEEEGLTRAEIISYSLSAIGFIVIVAFAWILGSGKSGRKKPADVATQTPGLRISSAHSNDPYMTRRKVVKKTS